MQKRHVASLPFLLVKNDYRKNVGVPPYWKFKFVEVLLRTNVAELDVLILCSDCKTFLWFLLVTGNNCTNVWYLAVQEYIFLVLMMRVVCRIVP